MMYDEFLISNLKIILKLIMYLMDYKEEKNNKKNIC